MLQAWCGLRKKKFDLVIKETLYDVDTFKKKEVNKNKTKKPLLFKHRK